MNLLFDTNILIYLAKSPGKNLLNSVTDSAIQKIYISIVSIAELRSIALQNNWGDRKWQIINEVLDVATIVEINENLTNTYVEIDAYSQRRNPSYTNYSFDTPRNMGKNDLWIAATATILGLKLVTTDGDFNHLHQVFLEVDFIKT